MARVVGYDRSADVAVLQLQHASNLKTVSAAGSSKVTVGAAVKAVGNAGGSGSLTSATGTITGLGKTITASDDQGGSEQLTGLIETNAGVEPGDSGGPLLNTSGQVIGMNTAASTGYGYQAVAASDAYSIPIGKALTIAGQIEAGKATTSVHVGATPFLGIQVQAVDTNRYGAYRTTNTSGALIAGVLSGGPADAAGLEAGDLITNIEGRSVASPATITTLIMTKKPGERISIGYTDQSGAAHTTTVKLGGGPPQ